LPTDSPATQTPREKLEAWLRYYEDLNLGAFYTDRRTMGKRSITRAAKSSLVELPAMPPALAVELPEEAPAAGTSVKSAQPAAVLSILNSQGLFENADRIEGDTLERIRDAQ
jgi:hypothetical protein